MQRSPQLCILVPQSPYGHNSAWEDSLQHCYFYISTCCEHQDSADGYFITHTPGPTDRRAVNKHCKKRDIKHWRCLKSHQKETYLQFQRLAFWGGGDACLDRSSKLKKMFKNNSPEVLNTRFLWKAEKSLGRTVLWVWGFGGFGLFVWFCCWLVGFLNFIS